MAFCLYARKEEKKKVRERSREKIIKERKRSRDLERLVKLSCGDQIKEIEV